MNTTYAITLDLTEAEVKWLEAEARLTEILETIDNLDDELDAEAIAEYDTEGAALAAYIVEAGREQATSVLGKLSEAIAQ